MQYRTMPKSEDKLSALGFGCMRLPSKTGGATIDKKAAMEQVRYAIDHGVNYVDTAYLYPGSEAFLGECLKEGYREKVFLATKLPCGTIAKRESMNEIFQTQLDRLQTDYIDYYLLHSMDGDTWDKMLALGIIEFMNGLRQSEKIRHMGFSFHGSNRNFKRMVDGYDWDFAQVQFNFLDENFQAGIDGIRYAHEKGLGIIIMEPLRGGSITHKIPKEAQEIYKHAAIQRTPAEWGLRWVWNHPEITVVLSGMNDMENVKENIKTAETALPDSMTAEELDVITKVRDSYHFRNNCTGCAYCMPCTAGINIPLTFSYWNKDGIEGGWMSKMYHSVMAGIATSDGKKHWASSCIGCGACEKKCPQHLPIRENMKQVHKDLETPFWRAASVVMKPFMSDK